MFVRKKRNKSGSVSVQVYKKDNGYKVVQTIGSSRDANEIERLVIQGRQFIKSLLPPGVREADRVLQENRNVLVCVE